MGSAICEQKKKIMKDEWERLERKISKISRNELNNKASKVAVTLHSITFTSAARNSRWTVSSIWSFMLGKPDAAYHANLYSELVGNLFNSKSAVRSYSQNYTSLKFRDLVGKYLWWSSFLSKILFCRSPLNCHFFWVPSWMKLEFKVIVNTILATILLPFSVRKVKKLRFPAHFDQYCFFKSFCHAWKWCIVNAIYSV